MSTPAMILSPTERMGLTGSEQAVQLGIPKSVFNRWARQGYVYDTTEEQTPGSGSPRRRMTDDEANRLQLMYAFATEGLAAAAAHRIATDVIATGHTKIGPFTFTAATARHNAA